MLLSACSSTKISSNSPDAINDGPYIDINADQLTSHWVCNDKYLKKSYSIDTANVDACGLSAQVHDLVFSDKLIEYNGNFNIVALSDMHGQFDLSVELMRNNGIIDENNDWSYGDGHFVITGDVFDRGAKVTEILWLLYKLDKQAELAGGKLHLLLGNHEVMVLNGDLRYLHKKYQKVSELLDTPFEKLFTSNSLLGRWLRSKPVLAKVNGYLFAHGGFHPDLAKHHFTLSDVNDLFKANLVKSELNSPRQGWGKYMHKTNGPIWYRGYFKDDGASHDEINMLLKHFDVKKVVVGHTSQKQIETRYEGKVIAIDTSIKRGKYGEVLFIENDVLYRGTLNGEKHPL